MTLLCGYSLQRVSQEDISYLKKMTRLSPIHKMFVNIFANLVSTIASHISPDDHIDTSQTRKLVIF